MAEPELSAAMKARLDELEQQNEAMQRTVKRLEFEWNEWYDKFRLVFARLSKRVRDWEKASAGDEETAQDAPGATIRKNGKPTTPPLPIARPPTSRNY